MSQAPIPCEYERGGRACGNIARVRLTFVDDAAPPGISGEKVTYPAHACFECSRRAKQPIPNSSIRLTTVEEL